MDLESQNTALNTRKKRPLAITILSWLYIAIGVLGTTAHFMEFARQKPSANEVFWITVLGISAVAAGVSMLLARNWARWLALAWMAAHVAISAVHPHRYELIVHCLLFVLFAFLLLRRDATAYFARTQPESVR